MQIKEIRKLYKKVQKGKIPIVTKNSKIQFECKQCGLCCFNNNVILNSYDMIRIRHAIKKSTTELFQSNYIKFTIGESSGLPVVLLNSNIIFPNKIQACVFLKPNPKKQNFYCYIYKNRPLACRFYPLGRIDEVSKDGKVIKDQFIFQKEKDSNCTGLKTNKKITVKKFLKKAEFKNYDEGSQLFKKLIIKLGTKRFISETEDNKKFKPLLKEGIILNYIGNLLFNFDSINFFSNDKRVIKTIYDFNITHKDFMYVLKKIEISINKLIILFEKAKKKYQSDKKALHHLNQYLMKISKKNEK